MTGLLDDEIKDLTSKIDSELTELCQKKGIKFRRINGNGHVEPTQYQSVLGTHHYTAEDSEYSYALPNYGKIGLMCCKLARLKNASSYEYTKNENLPIKCTFN